MAMTPEGRVKAKLKKMFERYKKGLYYFCPVQNGMGAAGLDFHCVYKGRAFFVETKSSPTRYLTPRQEITALAMNSAWAPVFVVRSEQDIANVEAHLCKIDLSKSCNGEELVPSSSTQTDDSLH